MKSSSLDPTSLRVMADAYDKKGDRLFDLNRIEEANQCWGRAIDCRLEANQIEDRQREKDRAVR